MGVIASGTGISKKTAKNDAGLNALHKLVNNNHKARNIIGALLQKQGKKHPFSFLHFSLQKSN